MALGVAGDAHWEQETLHMAHGDVLLLYTDGVTEAHNPRGVLFGEERLLEALQASLDSPIVGEPTAEGLRDALMAEVRGFTAESGRSDDLTLMIVMRGPQADSTVPRIS